MSLKKLVRRVLIENDKQGLLNLVSENRGAVTALNRLIFDQDELVRWRAVAALGWVAKADPYLLEKIIGRLIYTMNDDSGSIGWTAPQALGEICANDPDLVEDFFPLVISSIKIPAFQRGVIWAIGRVGPVRPDLVEGTGPMLIRFLNSPEAEIRGETCRTLGRLRWSPASPELGRLVSDSATFTVYQDEQLVKMTVGQAAREALTLLNRP